ncbi:hypothetical protein D3C80_1172910 [compost metagenome]
MADVTGEQPLAVQGFAQAPQGRVERHGQFTYFIGGIVRGQRRCQAQQLITVAHLLRQAHHRCHHPPRQDPTEKQRQGQAEHKAYDNHREQHPLALFKIALVL